MMSSVVRHPLTWLLAAYLLIAGAFAVFTPAWQSPDEPAHYNYIAQVARAGCCPQIMPGDWDSAYLTQLTSARFRPDLLGRLEAVQYEDHQPPLYYLLAAPVFQLSDGSLTALRLGSALIGLGVVAGAYAISRALLPDRPTVALAAAALVAFVPQHVHILASVNNDGLAELVIASTLLAAIRLLKAPAGADTGWRSGGLVIAAPVGLGLLVGVGLLTKLSTLFLAGLVPLALLLRWRIEQMAARRDPLLRVKMPRSVARRGAGLLWQNRDTLVGRFAIRALRAGARRTLPGVLRRQWAALRPLARDLTLFALPVLVLGGVWWARNIGVYGFPDVFGLGAHDRVVADQLRTADLIADLGTGAYLSRAVQTTFNSFWGQFGWMALPLPAWVYGLILLLLLAAGAGWVIASGSARQPAADGQRAAWLILALTLALAVLAYLYYNTEFVQFQGRYLYPGLVPLALLLALGLDGWRRIFSRYLGGLPAPLLTYLPALPALLLAPLNLFLLWRVIVPGLSP